jgi:hypothetical protein
MQLPIYNPSAKCPKCYHDDISTQYVKQGGRYGQPCEFYPTDIREHEHMHRHCRRCSYEWCESCSNATETPAERAKHSTGMQKVATLRPTLKQLRKISGEWADLMYSLEKFSASHDLLLTRYAKFHVGDRVQLGITPAINETSAPGWMGSKHFLVAGASGTVHDADVCDGVFRYQVVFDVESWVDSKGETHKVPPDKRHSYCFSECYLVATPPAEPRDETDPWSVTGLIRGDAAPNLSDRAAYPRR